MFFKKECFITLMLFTFVYVGKSQSLLGIQIGLSNSCLNTNINNRIYSTNQSNIGFTCGITFHLQIKSGFYAEIAPDITQKNYSINRTDSLTGIYESFVNTYSQLPLIVHGIYGNRLKVFADIGLYGAYWFAGKVKGKIPDIFSSNTNSNITGESRESFQLSGYNEKYQFDRKRDNRWEFGWIVGAGMQYPLNKKYSFFVKGTCYQSLTDQQKKYMVNQIPKYNQTFTCSLGMMRYLH
jgi:opacity protein-like surface antigen